MKPSIIFKKLVSDGLLKSKGKALDLGFGSGTEVINLANIGFEVDAVDSNPQVIINLQDELKADEYKDFSINLHNQKIEDFKIENEKYDCVIASNSLPFIIPKEKVIEIIKNIVPGLKKDGCMYITVFGVKDGWIDKQNMCFFEYKEIKDLLDSLGVKFYHSTIEEGYGKTMKGNVKYWNVFKFIYIKN
ncbi:MAG TPA: methyltransferase domain-containing protein [Candidatus Paceibacterota bacterium]